MKCKKCGNEVRPGEKFCKICGSKIESPKEDLSQKDEMKEKAGTLKEKVSGMSPKQKVLALAAAILALVIIVKGAGIIIFLGIVAFIILCAYEFSWYQDGAVARYQKNFDYGTPMEIPEGMSFEDVMRLIQEKLIYPHKNIQVKLGLDGEYRLNIETNISGSEVEIVREMDEQKEGIMVRPAGKMISVSYPESRMIKNEISKILYGKPADIDVQEETIRIKRWSFDLKAIRILKRFRLIIILALILGSAAYAYFLYSHQYVDMVKKGSPMSYPGITYERAFDNFFKNPKWTSFKADTGERVVEFSGKCLYQNQEVTVTMQFVISDDDNTFNLQYCAMNDIPQNLLMSATLIDKAFESY